MSVLCRLLTSRCDTASRSFCPHEEWLLASCSWSINDEFTTQGSIHYWRPHMFLTASEEEALKQVRRPGHSFLTSNLLASSPVGMFVKQTDVLRF
jgi:hypothetical protein